MPRRRRTRRFLPPSDWHRHVLRAWLIAPRALRLAVGIVAALALWAAANWTYQALRKPTELLFPVSDTLAKTPSQTWREYGPHFRKHATAVMTPELLAALAQIEASGNPLARTYWRWQPSWHPFEIYRPASSAVGMYQITDGTFVQGRRQCLPDARRSDDEDEDGPVSCWFDGLYSRVVPSEAVELTSKLLDRAVAATLRRERIRGATLAQKQELAAVIHLCGAGAGKAYARHRFRPAPGQHCGDHDVRDYLARVQAMKRLFARLDDHGRQD